MEEFVAMPSRSAPWSRKEQLVALRLYLTEPFGRLHSKNPRVILLAKMLGNRTPGALSMKACNFASLDPTFRSSGRKGLSGASHSDEKLWEEFSSSRAELVDAMESLVEPVLPPDERTPTGPSETRREVTVRRHQRFFRDELLATYAGKCAVTKLDVPDLLVASHIIPWRENEARRTDASNGILLNALLDRAFDRGLITFDSSLRLVCSPRLRQGEIESRKTLLDLHGSPLAIPERAPPDEQALSLHRERWGFAA